MTEQYDNNKKFTPLSAEEMRELIQKAQAGDKESRNRVVMANIRLAQTSAKHYSRFGGETEDLVHDGVIGLITAIDKFDLTVETAFSTYATYWIRQSVLRAITNKGHMIRPPSNTAVRMISIRRTKDEMAKETGREITNEELAKKTGYASEKITKFMALIHAPASLNKYLDEGDGSEMMALMEDPMAVDPEEEAIKQCLRSDVEKILTELPKRDAEIFKARIGWETGEVESLRAIGKRYGISAEGVRRVEKKVLAVFKKKKNRLKFADFAETATV